MKQKYLYSIGIILMLAVFMTACKKNRGPRLIVHVQEENGTAGPGAIVRAWYGPDANQSGSTLNSLLMDQTGGTDAAGDITFDFKYSAVLDIDVIYYKNYLDALLNPVTDTLYGHKVVKIEEVRQRSHENTYRETVKVK